MGMKHNTVFVSLKNDLLFHMVFTRNLLALKSLLSVLLGIPETSFTKIDILNPIQYSDPIQTRETVLDLKVHLDNGTYVLIEMQVRKFDYWPNRTLTYASRAVADQAVGEFGYEILEPVIQISIMNYSLFPKHRRFFAKYTLKDAEGFEYTDKLQFYVLDLTQIHKATDEQKKQGLVEWARAFRAKSWDEVNNIDYSGVKEAAKTMEIILTNPQERELLRRRQFAEYDWNTMIGSAERRGEKKGMKEGMKEGEKKGKAEVARSMKYDGVDPTFISKYFGLTLEEISAL